MTSPSDARRRPIVAVGAFSVAYEGLPADLATTRAHQAAAMIERLRAGAGRPVVDLGLVTDLAGAEALGPAVAAARPAAIVILSLGAIRADLGSVLAGGGRAPVLVWAGQDRPGYAADHQPIDAVAGAGPVGAYAVANALVRDGRPVRCEIGEELGAAARDWLRAAGVAADLAGARFGLVGGRWPGMLDVHLDEARFTRDLGATWEDVTLPTPDDVDPLVVGAFSPPATMDAGLIAASCRVATALRAGAADLDGVAVRCHSAAVGTHPSFGVMGCLGVSRLTSDGTPSTCTGDMVTAVAMFIADRVAGAAQYLEIDGPDRGRDALLLSNGGEIDLRSARADSVSLVDQQFFSGSLGRGLAFRGLVTTGPATIVAFTETPESWRLISLEGEVIDDHLAGFPVTHAFFRSSMDATEAWRRLGGSGAPHHVALAPGHLGGVFDALGSLLPIEHVAIGRALH